MDLPGFGRTIGPRGHVENFRCYQKVINSMVALLKGEYPGQKLFLIGESMGGLVAADYCITVQDQVAGAVFISPAIITRFKMPWRKKSKCRAGSTS